MKGRVDSWSNSTAAGMLIDDDGTHRSFAASDVIESEPTLPGALVEFTASESDGKPAASNIRVLRRVEMASAAEGVVITDIKLPFFSVAWLVLQVAVVSFVLWLILVGLMAALHVAIR